MKVATGAFALIALYTALTQSEKLAGLIGTSTGAVRRLSSPDVALIPRLAAGQRDNSQQAVYGTGGGQYIGSTFVPNSSYSVNVPQTAGQ